MMNGDTLSPTTNLPDHRYGHAYITMQLLHALLISSHNTRWYQEATYKDLQSSLFYITL